MKGRIASFTLLDFDTLGTAPCDLPGFNKRFIDRVHQMENKDFGDWTITWGGGFCWIFHHHENRAIHYLCIKDKEGILGCKACKELVPDALKMMMKLQGWNSKEKNES